MARQCFASQLTRYDERGWRPTFCTTGIGTLAQERGERGMGAHALARDAENPAYRASCRPMKSRIIARALSVSALACPVKPWRAPGKWTRSIEPPACV